MNFMKTELGVKILIGIIVVVFVFLASRAIYLDFIK